MRWAVCQRVAGARWICASLPQSLVIEHLPIARVFAAVGFHMDPSLHMMLRMHCQVPVKMAKAKQKNQRHLQSHEKPPLEGWLGMLPLDVAASACPEDPDTRQRCPLCRWEGGMPCSSPSTMSILEKIESWQPEGNFRSIFPCLCLPDTRKLGLGLLESFLRLVPNTASFHQLCFGIRRAERPS